MLKKVCCECFDKLRPNRSFDPRRIKLVSYLNDAPLYCASCGKRTTLHYQIKDKS